MDSGMLKAMIDLTTTEVCDMLMGGVFPADEDRFGAAIRAKIPYIGGCGALDMVNFGPPDTVPQKYADRLFYEHNPQVTLMRTTAEENDRMGRWIGERLNLMTGSVRFYLPEGGVSALDDLQARFDVVTEENVQTKARADGLQTQRNVVATLAVVAFIAAGFLFARGRASTG